MTYSEFLDKKHITAQSCGFNPGESTNCSMAFEWQNDIWRWALRKGRAALFEELSGNQWHTVGIYEPKFCPMCGRPLKGEDND